LTVAEIIVPLRRKIDGNQVAHATTVQGNPVKIRNSTCCCNPLKTLGLLTRLPLAEHQAGKAKQTGEKSEDLPSLKENKYVHSGTGVTESK